MSSKQKAWQLRNNFLWRMKGICTYFDRNTPMTEKEIFIINSIRDLRDELINNSVQSSRDLGFKALYRDSWGNILKEDKRNKQIQNEETV